MSTLRIRLQPSQYGLQLDLGALANIYDVTSMPKRSRKNLRDQIISGVTDIKLDAGQYVVEAILPSGETLYQEISLSGPGETKDVVLGSESSHEWLAMQHFIGNTRRKATSDGLLRRRSFTKDQAGAVPMERLPVQVTAQIISSLADPLVAESGSSWGTLDKYFQKYEANPQFPSLRNSGATDDNVSALPIRAFQPTILDQDERVFEFDNQLLADNQYPLIVDYHSPSFTRHYIMVLENKLASQFAVLPVPWIQDLNREHKIQVLVNLPASRVSHETLAVSIAIPDRRVGAVIGYLGSGLLPTAEKLVKTATDMLYDKMVNPIAAAAGAYVMVFAEKSNERDEWHKWVENLMNWFPWLPDGAIIHSWLKLIYGNKNKDLVEARKNLLEGFRRGLPFYSKGVKMLLDGLTIFANDAGHKDIEIEDALKTVRRIAINTNMRQPFTTISLLK